MISLCLGFFMYLLINSEAQLSPLSAFTTCADLVNYAQTTCNILAVSGGQAVSESAITSCCAVVSIANQNFCYCDYSVGSDSSLVSPNGTVFLTGAQFSGISQNCGFNTSAFSFSGNSTCQSPAPSSGDAPALSPSIPEFLSPQISPMFSPTPSPTSVLEASGSFPLWISPIHVAMATILVFLVLS